jgi:hypothetical protein
VRIKYLFYLSPLLSVGCTISTALNPTVSAYPGPNKSPQAFLAEQIGCQQFADQQISGARRQAIAALLAGENAGSPAMPDAAVLATAAAFQQPFDAAYAQCMYASGNYVPGYAPAAVVQEARPNPTHRSRRAARRYVPRKQQPASAQTFVEPAVAAQPASTGFEEPPPTK